MRFVVTNEEATVKPCASGELSMSSDAQAQETYESIGKMDNYRESYATASNFYLKLNHQVAPTDDVHIRKAIAYATDCKPFGLLFCQESPRRSAFVFKECILMIELRPMIWQRLKHVGWQVSCSVDYVEIMFVADPAFEGKSPC